MNCAKQHTHTQRRKIAYSEDARKQAERRSYEKLQNRFKTRCSFVSVCCCCSACHLFYSYSCSVQFSESDCDLFGTRFVMSKTKSLLKKNRIFFSCSLLVIRQFVLCSTRKLVKCNSNATK